MNLTLKTQRDDKNQDVLAQNKSLFRIFYCIEQQEQVKQITNRPDPYSSGYEWIFTWQSLVSRTIWVWHGVTENKLSKILWEYHDFTPHVQTHPHARDLQRSRKSSCHRRRLEDNLAIVRHGDAVIVCLAIAWWSPLRMSQFSPKAVGVIKRKDQQKWDWANKGTSPQSLDWLKGKIYRKPCFLGEVPVCVPLNHRGIILWLSNPQRISARLLARACIRIINVEMDSLVLH
jgi:hypothetical protein